MNLKQLARKLRDSVAEQKEQAFLIGLDHEPLNRATGAQDKDVWNLVGPIATGRYPIRYLVKGRRLRPIVKKLKEVLEGNSETRQQTFVLFHVPEPIVAARANGGAQDKDVWNLSRPIPSQSVVSLFPPGDDGENLAVFVTDPEPSGQIAVSVEAHPG